MLKQCNNAYGTKSGIFDNDRCAANILYSMAQMRYKQGKGDPSGFKQFRRLENIKPGMIVRFVGNRLHVLFHLAGVMFMLQPQPLRHLKEI